MNWKYYIPHAWKAGERVPWAEVWLLPLEKEFSRSSICLTIDALGDSNDPTHGSERAEFQKEALRKLGDKSIWIAAGEMIVRCRDFDSGEFLDFVEAWLRHHDSRFGTLTEGTFEEFSGTSRDAKLIERIFLEYPDSWEGR